MADQKDSDDDVRIEAADHSLLNKFGKANLDRVLSPEAAKKAEKIIANATDGFYVNCLEESKKLRSLIENTKKGGVVNDQVLQKIIVLAFAIKTNGGQAGYDLVASLAKSLHILCEETPAAQVTPPVVKVIEWHENSISQLLSLKVKGNGGDIGTAILAEIEKLNAKREYPVVS